MVFIVGVVKTELAAKTADIVSTADGTVVLGESEVQGVVCIDVVASAQITEKTAGVIAAHYIRIADELGQGLIAGEGELAAKTADIGGVGSCYKAADADLLERAGAVAAGDRNIRTRIAGAYAGGIDCKSLCPGASGPR